MKKRIRYIHIMIIGIFLILLNNCKKEEVPTVTTANVTNITQRSAVSGGTVTNDGGSEITSRGICWNTDRNPVTIDNATNDGIGTGIFTSNLIGLTANVLYYVRAYAINSAGIGYGNEITFATIPSKLPTITTINPTSISLTTAVSGGNILDDGGSSITSRGVCWSKIRYPTIYDEFSINGSGTGIFSSDMIGLSSGTIYYVRAYAYNDAGLAYGNEIKISIHINDIDDNIYETISIDTLLWIKENLKTTRYNNGIPIENTTDDTTWFNANYGTYCYYRNDEFSYKNTYGALYNWYAVNSGNLCPIGWHVPTDADWSTLENYLSANGYNYDGTTSGNYIAKSLAATTNWEPSSLHPGDVGNTDYPEKRNVTGFTALPGGYRKYNGKFYNIGYQGYWWAATEYNATSAFLRYILYDFNNMNSSYFNKKDGFSVRCLKD